MSLKLRKPKILCLERTIAIAEFDAFESEIKLVAESVCAVSFLSPCNRKGDPVVDGGRR